METFYFEMTDTFGGELNYCWLDRYTIEAKNIRGALIKLSKDTGLNFRHDGAVYRAKRACIAVYEVNDGMEAPDTDWVNKSKKL